MTKTMTWIRTVPDSEADDKLKRALEAQRERLASLPGVQSASIASAVPFGMLTINRPVQRSGVKAAPDSHPTTAAEGLAFNVRWSSVGADFFTTMGPLLRGRAFTKSEAEIADSPPVAILDEVLAKKLWPEGDAFGRRIQWAEACAPTAAGGGENGTMGWTKEVPRSPQDERHVRNMTDLSRARPEHEEAKSGTRLRLTTAHLVLSHQ